MKHFATSSYNNKKIFFLFTIAVLLFLTATAFGLMLGSTKITFSEIINAVKNGAVGTGERIFLFIRLPRTLACLAVGAALSVAGAIIQNVLNNRLASPSIIGVNSGAGLAVTLCTAFGLYGGFKMAFFAFVGALTTVMIINLGAQRLGASRGTVILMGVAANALLNALSEGIATFNPDIAVMSADFKVGDFSAISVSKLIPGISIICVALFVCFTLSNELDILTLGRENAMGLGMNVALMQTIFLVIAALLSASAVSLAGLISFVGLIVPHVTRLLGVNRSKHLLPLCALFGGGFVCVCDLISRTLFSPYEIPVGIILAVLGAPFFVFILIRGKGGHRNA